MPITKITTNATTQIKSGLPGKLLGIFVSSPGTTWTIQVNDGPNPPAPWCQCSARLRSPFPPLALLFPGIPMDFSNGLQIVTAGGAAAGELEVAWG